MFICTVCKNCKFKQIYLYPPKKPYHYFFLINEFLTKSWVLNLFCFVDFRQTLTIEVILMICHPGQYPPTHVHQTLIGSQNMQ
jgi:hypothetical protein